MTLLMLALAAVPADELAAAWRADHSLPPPAFHAYCKRAVAEVMTADRYGFGPAYGKLLVSGLDERCGPQVFKVLQERFRRFKTAEEYRREFLKLSERSPK